MELNIKFTIEYNYNSDKDCNVSNHVFDQHNTMNEILTSLEMTAGSINKILETYIMKHYKAPISEDEFRLLINKPLSELT